MERVALQLVDGQVRDLTAGRERLDRYEATLAKIRSRCPLVQVSATINEHGVLLQLAGDDDALTRAIAITLDELGYPAPPARLLSSRRGREIFRGTLSQRGVTVRRPLPSLLLCLLGVDTWLYTDADGAEHRVTLHHDLGIGV